MRSRRRKKLYQRTVATLGVNINGPEFTDEDRAKFPFIESLNDSELATCMLNNDPRIGADGAHPHPGFWAYFKHHRPSALVEYQRRFYSKQR